MMDALFSEPSFEQLFEPSANSHPFDMDFGNLDADSFLSFSSLGDFGGPGEMVKQVQPFWMDEAAVDVRVDHAKGQARASLSDLALAFNFPSPPQSAASSECVSNTPYFHSQMGNQPSPTVSNLPLPPSILAFPYDSFQDNFNLSSGGGNNGAIESSPFYNPYADVTTPVRGLNNKDSMESFSSSMTAPSEILLTPQLRPHTSAGELAYVTPLVQSQTPSEPPYLVTPSVLSKRHSVAAIGQGQVYGQSPARPQMSMGQQHRRRGSGPHMGQTLERVMEEGQVYGMEVGPMGYVGAEYGPDGIASTSYLMPSAEIVGNIPNWQATVPTYNSQQDFEAAMTATMSTQAFQLEMPIGHEDSSYLEPLPQWNMSSYYQMEQHQEPQAQLPLSGYLPVPDAAKSVSMRKAKSMDHVRKVSGGKPKALFAFHPSPLPSTKAYPAAFSTMPLSHNMTRAETVQTPYYRGDVFNGPSVMAPPPMARGPSHQATPKPIPSVLAQPSVDPTSTVWPPLPPRAPVVTIAPLTLSMPLDFLHNPAPSVFQEIHVQDFQGHMPQRMTMESASVMQPAPFMNPSPPALESMEAWNLPEEVHASQALPVSQAPPILTCVPLARPPPSAASARVVSPMPKAPRVRAPSKAVPKSRKVSKANAQAGFGFINFTAIDADKLLTGVAPSGSQKRKRDDSTDAGSSDGESAGLIIEGTSKKARV